MTFSKTTIGLATLVAALSACELADVGREILTTPGAGATSPPPEPPPPSSPTSRFVGYSVEAVTGFISAAEPGAGLFGFYGACQDAHGPGSRACTVEEVLSTPDLPPPPEDPLGAWIFDGIAGRVSHTTELPGCLRRGSGSTMPVLLPEGTIVTGDCDGDARLVACCVSD